MAYGLVPTPGKVVNGIEVGPCVQPCQHKDCAKTRQMAEAPCRICGQPIGYETPYFQEQSWTVFVHMACEEGVLEAARADR